MNVSCANCTKSHSDLQQCNDAEGWPAQLCADFQTGCDGHLAAPTGDAWTGRCRSRTSPCSRQTPQAGPPPLRKSREWHHFFAFGHRDLGRWDVEAVEQIDDIARFQSLRSSNPDARRHLWQRLGITLQRGSAALFARRRPTQPTYVDSLEER